ncbi:MAG: transposase [Anaerolineales bacterium]|nr:transposase [Anaerolineales bacterium]
MPLLVGFTPARLRHALNVSEALPVCTARHKTLAELTRWLRAEHADEIRPGRLFPRQPWSAEAVRAALLRAVLQLVAASQAKTHRCLLFVSVDDSLCCKDIAIHKLEAVSLHFDHVRQRGGRGATRMHNG